MRNYALMAILGASLIGLPLVSGCDSGTTTEKTTTTSGPNGTSTDKTKTTTDANGNTKTTTEHESNTP